MRVGVSSRLGSPTVGAWIIFKRVSKFAACCVGGAAAHAVKLPVGLKKNASQPNPDAWEIRTGRPARRRATTRNIDHASHANSAVRVAEVRINAWLRKRVLINRALVRKNSRYAVRVIRGTK